MEQLIFFAFWAGLIYLMMRFGCGAHIMGHGHRQAQDEPGKGDGSAPRWVAPAKDVDPVCGKTVATDNAKSSVYAGNVYYLCSRECREVFEAAPDLYSGGGTDDPNLEHSHA